MVYFFIKKSFVIIFLIIIFFICSEKVFSIENEEMNLNIYIVNPELLETYDVIKKGTSFTVLLSDDFLGRNKNQSEDIHFKSYSDDSSPFDIECSLSKLSKGGRFSNSGSVQFSTNKLDLNDGREVYFSANSPLFNEVHPSHASGNSIGLARFITGLSLTASPVTLGASLGAGFLIGGLFSAYKNGPGDFLWGGLDGSGLSFVERIFRKQPDVFLPAGSPVPFILSEDLKISQGIQKEKTEKIYLSNEEALKKIEQLLKWGDLAGALEMSIKTGQKEKYEELMKKISS